jgi:DNA repair exonuclease SbcCD ATPase subunit
MSADVLVIYHHIIAGAQESLDTTANTHFMFWSETNLTKCIVALAAAVQAQQTTIRELQARVETTTWYNGTLLTELSALRMRAAELETILKKQHDAEIIMM